MPELRQTVRGGEMEVVLIAWAAGAGGGIEPHPADRPIGMITRPVLPSLT